VNYAAAAVLAYEAAALVAGGRVPTITALCRAHRWLAAGVTLGLAAHLITQEREMGDQRWHRNAIAVIRRSTGR
jgi:hypothetical protein